MEYKGKGVFILECVDTLSALQKSAKSYGSEINCDKTKLIDIGKFLKIRKVVILIIKFCKCSRKTTKKSLRALTS